MAKMARSDQHRTSTRSRASSATALIATLREIVAVPAPAALADARSLTAMATTLADAAHDVHFGRAAPRTAKRLARIAALLAARAVAITTGCAS